MPRHGGFFVGVTAERIGLTLLRPGRPILVARQKPAAAASVSEEKNRIRFSMESAARTLILGAGKTARTLAGILARTGDVMLIDTNYEHCRFAEDLGLPCTHGNALDKKMLREAGGERVGAFLAVTANLEVNALAGQLVRTVYETPAIHLVARSETEGHRATLEHLGATTLFGGPVRLDEWDYWLQHDRAERLGLTLQHVQAPSTLFSRLQAHRSSIPVAFRRGNSYLPVHSGSRFEPGDRVIVLRHSDALPLLLDRFDRLVARCPVLDLDQPMSTLEFFELVAATLSESIGLGAEELTRRFFSHESMSSTVVAPGFAIPHVIVPESTGFHICLARCREGISFAAQEESVHALFVLVRPPEERTFHLRALAAIAQIMQDPEFETRWLLAGGPEELRTLVLHADRKRYPERELQAR